MAPRAKIGHVDSAEAVGSRLRTAREQAGLSQRGLAFPGCSPAYLSRIESGARVPSLQLIRELARRLEVSEDYLAYGIEQSASAADPLFEAELALRMDETELAERLYRAELEAEDPERRAAALEGLGQLAFRAGEAEQAIELLEQSLSLYGEEAAAGRSALNDTLGRCYAFVGDLEAAVALFERSLRFAEEREDVIETVRFRVLLSSALSDAGQLGRAGEVLAGALAHADELSDPAARVRLFWAECRLHLLNERPDLAERYGRKLIELLELTDDSYRLARAYGLMAYVELDRGEPARALEALERASALFGTSGNEAEAAHLRLSEARALAQLGQLERAASLAMEVAGALADRPSEAGQSYTLLARTIAEGGDKERAIEILELACELLERTPNRFLVEAYALLAELLEAEGRKDEAFDVLRKAVAVQTPVSQRAHRE
jgi:tetratricopeptide (TPR) repeat protein